jgi:hypothetical protein
VRAFGRQGEGPGELRRVVDIQVGPRDSLWVFHSNRTFQVFSPQERYIRGGRLPGTWTSATPLATSELLYAAPIRTPARAGFPLHLLGPDGQVTRSFGAAVPLLDPKCSECSRRSFIVSGTPGRIWVWWLNRYQLEQWTLDGRQLLALERRAPWFLARTQDLPSVDLGTGVASPDPASARATIARTPAAQVALANRPPFISAINEGTDGIVWVVIARYTGEGIRYTVEAIHAVRGELVASTVLTNEIVMGMWPGGLIASRTQSPEGYYTFHVRRLEVRKP